MNQRAKVVMMALIIAAVLPVFQAAAQTSNASQATAGRFGSDVDDYMTYHWYSGVEFGKSFGFLGSRYNMDNPAAFGLAAGYARRFGSLYLGAYYGGRMFNYGPGTKTEIITPTYLPDGTLDQKVTSTQWNAETFSTNNQIDVLAGIMGMGFKLSFYENTTAQFNPNITTTVTEFTDGTVQYANLVDSYNRFDGTLLPKIGWGMNLNIAGLALRPFAEAGLGIRINEVETITKNYINNLGVLSGHNWNNTGSISNYITPMITLGAEVDIAAMTLGLEYGLSANIWNSGYDVFGISGKIKGSAAWNNATRVYTPTSYTDTVNITFVERTQVNHTITPLLSRNWDIGEGASIGLGFNVPIGIQAGSTDTYSVNTTTTVNQSSTPSTQAVARTTQVVKTYTGIVDESLFTISPTISLGAKVQASERLIVGVGVIVAPFNFTRRETRTTPNGYTETTRTTWNGNGYITENSHSSNPSSGVTADRLVDATTLTYLTANAAAGFTFNFTPNFAVDTVWRYNYTTGSDGFGLDMTTLNILFTLKN